MRLSSLVLAPLLLAPAPAAVQDVALPERTLVVGTKEVAPFARRDESGQWTGLSLELWAAVANQLGLEYELREETLEGLIEGLETGELDLSVAALTVTPERERRIDFSHPFHSSGLGIALPRRGSPVGLALRSLLSTGFLQAVGTLAVLIFLAGAAVWVFERRRNAEQFGGTPMRGLGEAFWWSAVTMTTVGYGDRSPRTLGGRTVALVWMFASIITISGLTAAIASTLTLSSLHGDIGGPEDLRGAGVVLAVRDTTGAQWLREHRVQTRLHPDAAAALEALRAGEGVAVVHDAPVLRHLTAADPDLSVLEAVFQRQDYAFGMALDSPLRKPVNAVLLELLSGPTWRELLERYLDTRP